MNIAPPTLVVARATPRAQLLSGRGRIDKSHPSCRKTKTQLFAWGCVYLNLCDSVLATAQHDFDVRVGARKVRLERVVADQSAFQPRR